MVLTQSSMKIIKMQFSLVWKSLLNSFSFFRFTGWEYTVEATLASYGPVEKVYHLCRRRRWIRERKFVKETKKEPDVCCVQYSVLPFLI